MFIMKSVLDIVYCVVSSVHVCVQVGRAYDFIKV